MKINHRNRDFYSTVFIILSGIIIDFPSFYRTKYQKYMFLVIVYKRTLVSGTPLNLINTYHLVRAHAIVCTYLGFALQNGIKVFLKLNLKFSYQSDIHLMRTNETKWFKFSYQAPKRMTIWAKFWPIKKIKSCMDGIATC